MAEQAPPEVGVGVAEAVVVEVLVEVVEAGVVVVVVVEVLVEVEEEVVVVEVFVEVAAGAVVLAPGEMKERTHEANPTGPVL